MSYFVRIFCQSRAVVTRLELAEYMDTIWYGDVRPHFNPPMQSDKIKSEQWDTLEVTYQSEKRPIVFHRNVDDRVMHTEIEEIIEERLSSAGRRKKYADLVVLLRKSHQVIAIELSAGEISEDASEMVDTVGAYLSSKYDGVLYEPDIAFYDKNMKILCAF